MKFYRFLFALCAVLFLLEIDGAKSIFAQKKSAAKNKKTTAKPAAAPADLPVVTQIDFEKLKAVLKSNADGKRPLLINFWATWCEPCREEFPELVKIDGEFRARGLEFVTVSLDNLSDIKGDVPKFLGEMKAKMPAYLLKTADEGEVISYIAPDWSGGLPLTVLYDADGMRAYSFMGIVKPAILRAEIEKVLSSHAK